MVKTAYARPTRVVAPARAYDHVYDPIYTVSSSADHQKALRKSLINSIERVPVWNNLFSEIGTFPSCGYRMRSGHQPLPLSVHDVGESSQFHQRNSHFSVDATGKERYIFFNRPLIPFMQAAPAEVILSPQTAINTIEQTPGPKTRTIATQSIFREESAQTVPYAPDYIVADPENPPEILHLQNWLPNDLNRISLTEIELIERDQARRAFQAGLPETITDEDFIKRNKLLQAQEMEECEYREAQIIALEKQKLQAIIDAIQAREAEQNQETDRRIKLINERNNANKVSVLDKIQKRRYNTMRKMNRARLNMQKNLAIANGRDIIADYSDFGSAIYAPLERDGKVPPFKMDALAEKQIASMGKSYQSIVALETTIPSNCMNVVIQKPDKVKTRLLRSRKGQAILEDIKKIDGIITALKSNPNGIPGAAVPYESSSPSHPKHVGVIRPATPVTMVRVDPATERQHSNAITIQRIVRGRAVQAEFQRRVHDSISLIRELMVTPSNNPADVLTRESATAYITDMVIGFVLSQSSSALRTDFNAHQQLTAMQALIDRAQPIRLRREAEQAGLRQKAFAARGKQHQWTQQVEEIISWSATSLLDDILQEMSSEGTDLNKTVVPDLSSSSTSDSSIVIDCIANVILPTVDSRLSEREADIRSVVSLTAVHDTLVSAFTAAAQATLE